MALKRSGLVSLLRIVYSARLQSILFETSRPPTFPMHRVTVIFRNFPIRGAELFFPPSGIVCTNVIHIYIIEGRGSTNQDCLFDFRKLPVMLVIWRDCDVIASVAVVSVTKRTYPTLVFKWIDT